MKNFIILCAVLGIFHVQVDATPVTQTTTDTYENEADVQKQLQTFLSEMIHTANEAKDSVVKTYAKDNEYFEYRSKHVNEILKEWSSSRNTATNSTECVAILAEANERLENITLSGKKNLPNCLNKFLEDIEKLKEETVRNIKQQKDSFEISNIRKSPAELQDFRTEIMYKTAFTVTLKFTSLETKYMRCIAMSMDNNNHLWDLIELSVIENCADKKSFEELFPLTPSVDRQYENENALRELIEKLLSNLSDILRKTNSSIAAVQEKSMQYGKYKMRRMIEFIKDSSLGHGSVESNECNQVSKNFTQLIEDSLAANESPYSYCFSELERQFQNLKHAVAPYKTDPLMLAKKQLRIPTRQVAWQKFMFEYSYMIEQSARYWVGEKIETVLECTQSETISLGKAINKITESLVKQCAGKNL